MPSVLQTCLLSEPEGKAVEDRADVACERPDAGILGGWAARHVEPDRSAGLLVPPERPGVAGGGEDLPSHQRLQYEPPHLQPGAVAVAYVMLSQVLHPGAAHAGAGRTGHAEDIPHGGVADARDRDVHAARPVDPRVAAQPDDGG